MLILSIDRLKLVYSKLFAVVCFQSYSIKAGKEVVSNIEMVFKNNFDHYFFFYKKFINTINIF